jgi:dihydrofolate reductase
MSDVVVAMFLTLDGVMENPGGGEGFQHGGWQLPFFDPDMATGERDGLFAAGALLLGRVTYEQFAAAWPSMTDEEGFAERMNSLPKYVASTTLREPLGWNATLLDGDVPAAAEVIAGDQPVPGAGSGAQDTVRLRPVAVPQQAGTPGTGATNEADDTRHRRLERHRAGAGPAVRR